VIARLKRRRDFVEIAGAGRKASAPGLVLQARRRPSGHPAVPPVDPGALRIGFTASRKVGIAVDRNRARRRLRAVAEEVMPHHAAPGHDYVVIARAATLRRPYRALVGDLISALRRAGALNPQTGG
jgi:ribonuclease P protein component